MEFIVMALGAALIICLLYLALSGEPIPPAFKAVVLVAVALMFLLCLLHAAGCEVGDGIGRPGVAPAQQ